MAITERSRSAILLEELGWRKGEPVVVQLRLAEDRPDLLVAFAVAAQLLARMPNTVARLSLEADVAVPASLRPLVGQGATLAEACAAAARRARLVAVEIGTVRGARTLAIGRDVSAALWCDGHGWRGHLRTGGGRLAPGAPLGAIVGACLLVDELFQLVHSPVRNHPRALVISAYDGAVNGANPLSDITAARLDFTLAGAGAVAQTLLWTLAATGVRASVFCADGDTVVESNLERLPFANASDVDARRNKVDVLERGLERTTVRMTTAPCRLEDALRTIDGALVLTVDDDRARERLQQLAPVRTIAATTGGLSVTVEWSDLDEAYACASCAHPVRGGPTIEQLADRLGLPRDELAGQFVADQLRALEARHGLAAGTLAHLAGSDVCGQLNEVARLALGIGGPSGSTGFLSWYAGVLLAGEILAQLHFGTPGPRARMMNLINPAYRQAKERRPRPDCACQGDVLRVYFASRRRPLVRNDCG